MIQLLLSEDMDHRSSGCLHPQASCATRASFRSFELLVPATSTKTCISSPSVSRIRSLYWFSVTIHRITRKNIILHMPALPSHTQTPPIQPPQLTHQRYKQILPSQPNSLCMTSDLYPVLVKRALVSLPPILHPLLPFKVRNRKNNRDLPLLSTQ
ncbi:hypothetical protein P692DRAFT_20887416 [Suillus brevipes Sb2]|nr:hypothetical protein P692DRAFT_20887416 [Suillus brevipes Sb2]